MRSIIFNLMVEHSLDAVYGAVSHPVRRRVLEMLAPGPARVTDLAADFDISLAAVSKHLGVLERAGLARRAVAGREHRLALEAAPLAPAAEWLATYRRFWAARLDALQAHLP
jgi:DNA-binding transcriptional ArsR family regulator